MNPFTEVVYRDLNSRQRENYNFAKISAILADYGFTTLRLSDDWQGADFIAAHVDGDTFLKVQLKPRFGIAEKYIGKDIWIAFPYRGSWFLHPHDALIEHLRQTTKILESPSWTKGKAYSWPHPPAEHLKFLEQYRLQAVDRVALDAPSADAAEA